MIEFDKYVHLNPQYISDIQICLIFGPEITVCMNNGKSHTKKFEDLNKAKIFYEKLLMQLRRSNNKEYD